MRFSASASKLPAPPPKPGTAISTASGTRLRSFKNHRVQVTLFRLAPGPSTVSTFGYTVATPGDPGVSAGCAALIPACVDRSTSRTAVMTTSSAASTAPPTTAPSPLVRQSPFASAFGIDASYFARALLTAACNFARSNFLRFFACALSVAPARFRAAFSFADWHFDAAVVGRNRSAAALATSSAVSSSRATPSSFAQPPFASAFEKAVASLAVAFETHAGSVASPFLAPVTSHLTSD